MIPEIDRQLTEWIANVVGDVTVSLLPPLDQMEGSGVSLYLLQMSSTPPASTPHVAPLQFTLHYLVTTWSQAPETAHQILGELVLAALDNAEMEVDLSPLAPEMWLALRALPRPAFVLRMLVRQPRPDMGLHYVTQPLVLKVGPSVAFVGQVLGPEDVPIMGARVECAALNLSAITDRQGRFRFAAVPANLPLRLLVKAKRRQTQVVTGPATDDQPFVIRVNMMG